MMPHPRIRARCGYSNKTSNETKRSDMRGYLTKLKAEMEGRLGCGIEVVEDRDLGCSCKIYRLDGLGLTYKQTCENALAMFESHRGKSAAG